MHNVRGMFMLAAAVLCATVLWGAQRVSATPLFAMQSAERCDTCHAAPDRSDPKWIEENTPLERRKCRLSCNVCHVNPSGGMLRNETGQYFGLNFLPSDKTVPEAMRGGTSAGALTLGGDFRFMALSEQDRDNNPVFFPMQADLYASARVLERLTFMSQFGLEQGGNTSVREAFGIFGGDTPYNSYVKAGKFMPPYGHRLADHTALIRSKLGFDGSDPSAYYSGVEVGAEPVLFFGRAAMFNQNTTPALNTDSSRRGMSAVAGWRGLWLHLGASYLSMENYEVSASGASDRSAIGIYGALRGKDMGMLDRLTYLFEFDYVDDSGPEEFTVSYNELAYRLMDGVTLKARQESFVSDTEDDEARYAIGADLYPYPFTEVTVEYRINRESGNEIDNNELMLIGHIWF